MKQNPLAETGSPQSILGALLADFSWELVPEPLPSTVFVKLLEVFDIDAASARVALERVCKKGLLDRLPSKGRLAQYRLSASAARRRIESVSRLLQYGSEPSDWDGTWTLLITSVPETRKLVRARLRAQLAAEGFACQYDAVWVKPNRRAVDVAKTVLSELEIEQGSIYNSEYMPSSSEAGDPRNAFELDKVQSTYIRFISEFEKVAQARMVRRTAAECLTLRIRLMDAWRSVIKQDPSLPDALLPAGYARGRARDVFLATYDALGPGAEACVREIAAQCGIAHTQLRHFPSSLPTTLP